MPHELPEEVRTSFDHMLRDCIKISWVQLHHVLVLDVVRLVDELPEGGIASSSIGVNRRRNAKKLNLLVSHLCLLELCFQNHPILKLSEDLIVVETGNKLPDVGNGSAANRVIKRKEFALLTFRAWCIANMEKA